MKYERVTKQLIFFQTLSLRNGKNTFSNLLKGKLLIIENVQQLLVTAFTAGVPSVTTEDDVVRISKWLNRAAQR